MRNFQGSIKNEKEYPIQGRSKENNVKFVATGRGIYLVQIYLVQLGISPRGGCKHNFAKWGEVLLCLEFPWVFFQKSMSLVPPVCFFSRTVQSLNVQCNKKCRMHCELFLENVMSWNEHPWSKILRNRKKIIHEHLNYVTERLLRQCLASQKAKIFKFQKKTMTLLKILLTSNTMK